MSSAALESSPRRIQVEMWTDLICPWCGIGEYRFKEALIAFAHTDKVDFSLRAYRLMPGEAVTPMEEVIKTKYGLSPKETAESFAKLESLAASVGLQYNLAGSWAGDTMDGHRLIKLAKEEGKEMAVCHRLLIAALGERKSIYDHAVLLDLAGEAGLDAARAAEVLGGTRYREEVEADEASMKRLGGRGVPFFMINGRYEYPGALSPDIFLQGLQKAWEEGENAPSVSADGMICGPDGCVLPPA